MQHTDVGRSQICLAALDQCWKILFWINKSEGMRQLCISLSIIQCDESGHWCFAAQSHLAPQYDLPMMAPVLALQLGL